ncbi:MAG: ORF6N domain-containing protein [Candidatus Margulisbacteria bacterium]|nr:ORF6N domain-containing protein [Candidatus Margulisiibacteriota bacterium]
MDKLIPIERIENQIFQIRGQRVMLDRDLADLYGVETKYLNRQVKRNIARFPKEYMFQLTPLEKTELVTNWHRFELLKHSTSLPNAFTEHGIAMLSAVLNSTRAVKVSIMIINAFIRLRRSFASHKELAVQIAELKKIAGKHDLEINGIIKLLRKLMEPVKTEAIGFRVGK